jgi:putative pre-16S rRNA nuclease
LKLDSNLPEEGFSYAVHGVRRGQSAYWSGRERRSNEKSDFEVLARLVEDNEVRHIVVGNPLNMDGTVGRSSSKMHTFAERLRGVTPVEVSLWDERLSSFTAEQLLIERGRPWSKRKQEIDKLSAVVILQDYLDHHNSSPTEEMTGAEDHG